MSLKNNSINLTLSYLHNTGLTDSEKEIPFITDEPKIPSYVCFPSRTAIQKYNNNKEYGQGFSVHNKLARLKSVAECLERLCQFNPIENKLISSCYKHNNIFIDPSIFCYYSKYQIPNKKNFLAQTKKEKYKWYPTKDLISGNKILLPAQIIFLSNHFDNEFQIGGERISTGAALGVLGSSYALKAGFFEVIERDSCMFSYLTKRKIRRIVNMPTKLNYLISYLERYRLEPNIFDITTDLKIPTILSVVYDHTGIGPAVNIGARASTNYFEAINDAILESIQCRRGCRINQKIDSNKNTKRQKDITKIEERYKYWHPLKRIKDLESWLMNSDIIEYRSLNKSNITFEHAVKSIKDKGYHIFVADISLPELRKNGLEVLKVIIPELHPLYISEKAKALYSVHYGDILDNNRLKPHPFS